MELSFSAGVKNEICRQNASRGCCAVAEAYGVLMYCNTFSSSEIRIITENRAFASRLPKLFKRAFALEFDTVSPEPGPGGKHTLVISRDDAVRTILETFGTDPDEFLAHHVNFGVLEDDCCRTSFIRGAFMAGGSVTDPQKRYHLELVTAHYNVSRETFSLLLDLEFSPKSTQRGGNFVIYFKQSEYIEDFLTAIGAPVRAMELMNTKLEKDLRNSVNRRVNCDTANVAKTVDAAVEQVRSIREISGRIGLDALPDKLRELAKLRLENPEASVSELAELSEPPVTKSCLYHRMRKLLSYDGTEQSTI